MIIKFASFLMLVALAYSAFFSFDRGFWFGGIVLIITFGYVAWAAATGGDEP